MEALDSLGRRVTVVSLAHPELVGRRATLDLREGTESQGSLESREILAAGEWLECQASPDLKDPKENEDLLDHLGLQEAKDPRVFPAVKAFLA